MSKYTAREMWLKPKKQKYKIETRNLQKSFRFINLFILETLFFISYEREYT
jgi:hypothetical protein